MEQKINIAEILKDCPSGMELDCPLYDTSEYNVTFIGISEGDYFPIKIETPDGIMTLTKYGCFSNNKKSECIIFPKGKTTWEGFVPPYKFKDGDILFAKSVYDWIFIYKESGNDVDLYKYVSIPHNCSYKFITYDDNPICHKKEVSEIRLATEEEKQKLFDTIKDNGYKWNPETKTLEKLPKFKVGDKIKHKDSGIYCTLGEYSEGISAYRTDIGGLSITYKDMEQWELAPNKFDIDTLVPFESRVLVRNGDRDIWKPAIFGCYIYKSSPYYVLGGTCWKYCIPYEGNKHLLRTTNDCDDYYKFWVEA